jgi:hypothetical protein
LGLGSLFSADKTWMAPAQVPLAKARSPPSVSTYACFVVAIAVLLTPPLTHTAARSPALLCVKFLQNFTFRRCAQSVARDA